MKRIAMTTLGLAGLGGAVLLLKQPGTTTLPRKETVAQNGTAETRHDVTNQSRVYVAPAATPKMQRKDEIAELSPAARKVFFEELETVFGTLAVSGVPPSTLNKHLSHLNARGAAGLKSVVTTLSSPATVDAQVKRRLFLVDYLAYRMRWDATAKAAVIRLATAPISIDTPTRYRATTIAEQSELIEALIHTDFETGVAIIKTTSVPQLRLLGTLAVYEHLLNNGLSKAEAATKIRAFDPTFKI